MKRKALKPFLIIIVLLIATLSVEGQIKKNFRGTWDQHAPDAPKEYVDAKVTITKDTVIIKFLNTDQILPTKSISFKNDTLTYSIVNHGTEISHALTLESKTKIKGVYSWDSNEAPLFLTKQKKESKNRKGN
jgi:hypothetical protein